MDLKRAWRNGFLASLIFAIPLSDLYYNQYSNLTIDSSAREAHAQHATSALADANNHDDSGAAVSWDDNVGDNGLTIPGNTLAGLLLESGDTDFSDIQKTAIQLDPQDIFQSEQIGEIDLDTFGSSGQNSDDDLGSLASLTYGFGNSSGYATGFSGPFMPSMFAPGGKTASAEALFVDPLASTQTETGAHDAPADATSSGTDDESLHNVPEPSSFMLITIGTISVASLFYRRSKSPTRLS